LVTAATIDAPTSRTLVEVCVLDVRGTVGADEGHARVGEVMRTYDRGSAGTTRAGQALRLCLALILMVVAVVACSAAPGGTGGSSAPAAGGARASAATSPAASTQTAQAEALRAAGSTDWLHALQVVADLRAQPPNRPLVLMIGSSIVRESTISDASWAAQVQKRGGPLVAAYDLGSRNQSFAQDVKLVPYLPKVPTIVYIGVDVVRFVSPPSHLAVALPKAKPVPSGYDPHRYSSARVLPAAQKRKLVSDWMQNRYPVFSRYYAYNRGQLEKLIKACLARGLHPVLLDTPRNTPIISRAFDGPVNRYRATCRQLAAKYGIPFVDMVGTARFANSDFFDMWHAVQPGRAKWQLLLSNQTVTLLQRYGMR
jgi:hypothetical protein